MDLQRSTRSAIASFLLALAATTPTLAQESTLAKINASGSATMGVRDSSVPQSYLLADGSSVGFTVDICRRVLSAVQSQLGLSKLDIKYQTVTSQNRIPLVRNGTVDIECGSTTNNLVRQKEVAFSLTTYTEDIRMAVRADSGIRSVRDLANKTVVASTGTTSVQHLRRHERATDMNLNEVFGKDHSESFLMLETGRADAWVIDQVILKAAIASSKAPASFAVVGEVFNSEPVAIMFRKDDPEFKRTVDDAIRRMIASGEMKALWSKWFQEPIPPRGIRLGIEPTEAMLKLWASPNDAPMESYNAK